MIPIILATAAAFQPVQGHTEYSKLSKEAQELIVNAILGKYEKSRPPFMSDSVREEIVAWLKKEEIVELAKARYKKPVSF